MSTAANRTNVLLVESGAFAAPTELEVKTFFTGDHVPGTLDAVSIVQTPAGKAFDHVNVPSRPAELIPKGAAKEELANSTTIRKQLKRFIRQSANTLLRNGACRCHNDVNAANICHKWAD